GGPGRGWFSEPHQLPTAPTLPADPIRGPTREPRRQRLPSRPTGPARGQLGGRDEKVPLIRLGLTTDPPSPTRGEGKKRLARTLLSSCSPRGRRCPKGG